MFMSFSIYKSFPKIKPISIHRCVNGNSCNNVNKCIVIKEVTSIRYLGLIFDKNLRWNLHIQNLVGKLRSITYRFYKLRDLVPKQTMRVIYFALYQTIFQYGMLVWGGLADTVLNKLQVNQNNIIRIGLNKYSLQGSTNQNYRELGVLPIKFLYKKISILFTIKKFTHDKDYKLLESKRVITRYNIPVKYSKKSFGQSFVNYLGPVYYNGMPCQYKKNIHCSKINVNKIVYQWLFSQLT